MTNCNERAVWFDRRFGFAPEHRAGVTSGCAHASAGLGFTSLGRTRADEGAPRICRRLRNGAAIDFSNTAFPGSMRAALSGMWQLLIHSTAGACACQRLDVGYLQRTCRLE